MSIQREVELFNANKIEDRSPFKDVSGIYGLVYDDEVIYIGQSVHIGKRIQNHMANEKNIKSLMSLIRRKKTTQLPNYTKSILKDLFIYQHKEEIEFTVFKECSIDKEELDYYEEHYIRLFQPLFNYTGINTPFKYPKKANYYNQNEFTF